MEIEAKINKARDRIDQNKNQKSMRVAQKNIQGKERVQRKLQ